MNISKCLEKDGYLIQGDAISKAMLRDMLAKMQVYIKRYGHCHLELSVYANMPKKEAKWRKSKNYTEKTIRSCGKHRAYKTLEEMTIAQQKRNRVLEAILTD